MSKKVLVIDDEKAVRNSFLLTFEDSDYLVDVAENGKEGIEKFAMGKYDLIFLDLKMPDINGVEVLRMLRERDKLIPVYIITAFHKEFFEELDSARNQGHNFELLNKPLNRKELQDIVSCVLEN